LRNLSNLLVLAAMLAALIALAAFRDRVVEVFDGRPVRDDVGSIPMPAVGPAAAPASAPARATAVDRDAGPAPAGEPTRPPAEPVRASLEPRYAQPADVENLLLQFLARQSGLALVSISTVKCTATSCEIAFAGTQGSPSALTSEFQRKLLAENWNEFRFVSGSTGSREIAPGARESLMIFEYQPLEDLSDDRTIAARQQAACAAAWRRMTENPTPDDVVRQYLEQEEQRLALAATVLGADEARRIATESRGRGPVIRDCWALLEG